MRFARGISITCVSLACAACPLHNAQNALDVGPSPRASRDCGG
jgi:hypothetical protein